MRVNNVSNLIISSIKRGVVEQLSNIKREDFHGVSIQTVEKNFFKTIGKAGAGGLAELFLQNDVNQKSIVYNDEKHYLKFRSTGKYLTLLGEISLKRGIYQSNTSSKSLCPLEDKLKFINDYVSFAAAEYICYSLASMTPQEFSKHCTKWSLMRPSASTITRVVNYVGDFLETSSFYDTIRTEGAIPKEAAILAISMDATSVLIKKEGWRHAAVATISTYNVKGDRLDTIYIGRMPEKNKIKIKKLLVKEVESILSKQKFKQIVCIADGARENWIYFRKKYPNAIHITDFYHVAEHLAKLSALLFNNYSESKVWYKKYKSMLKNDPNGAAKTIRAVRYRRSIVKKNPEIEKEIKYLQQNQRRMSYFEYKQKNLPIGSGVVEAACKNLIGARLKKSGMSWSKEGGQNVLNLRALILSNRWERFWNYFLQSHFPNIIT
jgi:hypothetical protein